MWETKSGRQGSNYYRIEQVIVPERITHPLDENKLKLKSKISKILG